MSRRALYFGWMLVVCAMFGATPSSAQDPGDDPVASVPIVFDWPVGLQAAVDVTQRMVRLGTGADSDVTVLSRYVMDVEPHERGLAVRNRDGGLLEIQSDPPLADEDPLRLLYGAIAGVDMAYIVSGEGELLDVEGSEAAASAFRSVFGSIMDSVEVAPELQALAQAFQQMMTPEAMMASAADQWGGLVTAWAFDEFEEDMYYEFQADEPSPLMPDVMISMQYEMGFLQWVPCEESSPEPSCVSLELYSYPDPEDISGFMRTWVERMKAALGDGSIEFEAFEQVNHIRIVAEPSTLIPYHYATSKSIEGVVLENGAPSSFSRLDETVLSFRYER